MIHNKSDKKLPIDVKLCAFGKTKELGRVLGKEGTMEILDLLGEQPRQYTYLEKTIELSHTSLLRRLNRLKDLDMIEKEPIRSKRRETHTYNLTPRGEQLMKFSDSYEKEMTLPSSQQKIIEIEENNS